MQVFHGLDRLPSFKNAVVAIGSFDGVHLGHRQIFNYVKHQAHLINGESIIITFDPHPQQILHPENNFFSINTLEENISLIEKEGIDYLIVLPFTMQLSQYSFEQFLAILKQKIGVKFLVMGPNHHFGHNGEGNIQTMQNFCSKNSIEIILIPEFIYKENKVRSSKIREYIVNKEFTKAEALLGHPLKKI